WHTSELSYTSLFYDKVSNSVLGGRSATDGLAAVEFDLEARTRRREFRTPQPADFINAITRGPNGTVVAIDWFWRRIYQWKEDGTFLRAVLVPGADFSDTLSRLYAIAWAGTVASASTSPNTQPSISCVPIAPVDCA